MIRNIVFDMGWVLVEYKPKEYISEFIQDEADAAEIYEKMFRAPEWLNNDRGTVDPDDFIQLVCERIPARLHPVARQIWEHWHEYLKPIAETNALALQLKKNGYHLYLLSNVSTRYHLFRHIMPATSCMDGEFISADVHFIKPEKEIYQLFLGRFALNPAECFFIDDMPENIAAAKQAGIQGFCFSQDVNALKDALKDAGVTV